MALFLSVSRRALTLAAYESALSKPYRYMAEKLLDCADGGWAARDGQGMQDQHTTRIEAKPVHTRAHSTDTHLSLHARTHARTRALPVRAALEARLNEFAEKIVKRHDLLSDDKATQEGEYIMAMSAR